MATITSSTYVVGHAQANGMRYVTETHTWSGGVPPTVIEYGPMADGTDYQAIANARATQIMDDRARQECFDVLDGRVALADLTYQTQAQFADKFWARLRAQHSKDKIEFSRMIHWLHGQVTGGFLSSADVRVSFNAAYGRNLNVAQWNSFVTNTLTPIRDRYQAMLDQVDL